MKQEQQWSARAPMMLGLIAIFVLLLSLTGMSLNIYSEIGIILFSAAVLFQVITLPVEFDASRRALAQLNQLGLVTKQDSSGARSVLSAAAMTYVAAAATSIAYLLYFISASRD